MAALIAQGACMTAARADSLNYSDFSSTAGLTLNENAAAGGNNLVLVNGTGQYGSAFTNSKVDISSFTTTFQFQLVPTTSPPADGITFTIQGVSPQAIGAGGGYLGYGGSGGIGNSVAVKFDDYHANFNVDGTENDDPSDSTTGLLTDSVTPPGEDLSQGPDAINLNTDHVFEATLSYYGTALDLHLADLNTGVAVDRSFAVDIPSYVGGSTAYVGFTGGSGGFGITGEIESWSFNSPAAAPLPSSAWGGVALLGSLGIATAARKRLRRPM